MISYIKIFNQVNHVNLRHLRTIELCATDSVRTRDKLGVTPAQAQQQRVYWQTRMKFEMALRRLWRLTVEWRKVAEILKEGEPTLSQLAHQSTSDCEAP